MPRLVLGLLLALVLLAGFYVRVEDYSHWQERHNAAFFQDKPLLGALDGYYYLRLARDLAEGTYAREDAVRSVAHPARRPHPPPLLAMAAAGVARATGWSLDWIGAFLPPLLGILLAIPVFAYGRRLVNPVAGLAAALLVLLAPYYVYRSGMAWFDTDCMNVTWIMLCAYCFLCFGRGRKSRRYAWLAAGLACAGMLWWWWDTARREALLIGLSALPVALVLFYRPRRRAEWIVIAVAGSIALAAGLWQRDVVFRSLEAMQTAVASRFSAMAGATRDVFPGQAVSTSEQVHTSLAEAIGATTRNGAVFALGVAGFVWLLVCRTRSVLTLLPLLLLSGAAFAYAKRFVIFLPPLVALGLGHLVGRVWAARAMPAASTKKHSPLASPPVRNAAFAALCLVLVGVAAAAPLRTLIASVTSAPKTDAVRVAGMAEIATRTPTNAVVWSWWDNGYALHYWAQRAAPFDGKYHGGAASVYCAQPLATTNETFAADFIRFFCTRGEPGVRLVGGAAGVDRGGELAFLQSVLSLGQRGAADMLAAPDMRPIEDVRGAGADSWLAYLYPTNTPPIYLHLDRKTLETAHWWYWFATWQPDEQTGTHPFYGAFFDVTLDGTTVSGSHGLQVDVEHGFLRSSRGSTGLHAMVVRRADAIDTRRYGRQSNIQFEVCLPSRFATAVSRDIAESVFQRLFVRHDPTLKRFHPVLLNAPDFQIWEVLADREERKP